MAVASSTFDAASSINDTNLAFAFFHRFSFLVPPRNCPRVQALPPYPTALAFPNRISTAGLIASRMDVLDNQDAMTETSEEYKARLPAYVEGQDPIAMQRQAPGILALLIHSVPVAKLKAAPAPGKWSVTEILMHLAEDELTSTWRYRQMLQHDAPELSGFDQDLWARLSDYASWDPQDALAMFRLLREANLKMFANLTSEQWDRHGIHTERGKITIRDLCRHMAAHDINHIEQIRRILEGNR